MSWLSEILPGFKKKAQAKDSRIPEDLWEKCAQCGATNYTVEMEKTKYVCPRCDYHKRINVTQRVSVTFDVDSPVEEIGSNIRSIDVIKFNDGQSYDEKLNKKQNGDARKEAAHVYYGNIKQTPIVAFIFDFSFMGGSMGSVVGERFVKGVNKAIEMKVPFVTFSASGGARMQEGLLSLFQMGKTTSALSRLSRVGLPHISILTDPTTGGVAASYALIGDVIVAEPNALIGFAGPRVIQETVREKLPEGFQRSQFLYDHGAIDIICDRRELRDKLHTLFELLKK